MSPILVQMRALWLLSVAACLALTAGTRDAAFEQSQSTLSHPNVLTVPLTAHQNVYSPSAARRVPLITQRNGEQVQSNGMITVLGGCASSDVRVSPFSLVWGLRAHFLGVVWVQFSLPVTIGSQTFQVLLDTGSTTLAVASSLCGSECGGATLSPTYVPGPSANNLQRPLQSLYGSGSWRGRAFQDNVALGGAGGVQMVIAAIDTSTAFFRRSSARALIRCSLVLLLTVGGLCL
jgi:hypothetical protein